MILGKNGKWMWLTSKATGLRDVVERCPQFVIDKFVLVTSLDSGSLLLDESRLQSGWTYMGKEAQSADSAIDADARDFTLSPRVKNTSILPTEWYDEWYVFPSPPQIGSLEVFVNDPDFCLTIGHIGLHEVVPYKFEEQFWMQIERVNPFSFISDNGVLSFATSDGSLYEQVVIAVQDVEHLVAASCDARSATEQS